MSLRNDLHAHLGQAGLRAQLVTATVAQLVADAPVHTTELPLRALYARRVVELVVAVVET
jgi:hypothetical protein